MEQLRFVLPDVRWVVQSLVVLGCLAVWMFVKVNFLEGDLSISFPDTPKVVSRSK